MRVGHYITIFFGVLIIVLGALLLPAIEVNNDIKSTFTEESDKQQRFDSLNSLFKQREESLIISFTKEDGYNTYTDWKQLEAFTQSLKDRFKKDSIVSVFDINTFKKVGVNLYEKPLINLSGEDFYPGWEERIIS